jgi:hypothetical protein
MDLEREADGFPIPHHTHAQSSPLCIRLRAPGTSYGALARGFGDGAEPLRGRVVSVAKFRRRRKKHGPPLHPPWISLMRMRTAPTTNPIARRRRPCSTKRNDRGLLTIPCLEFLSVWQIINRKLVAPLSVEGYADWHSHPALIADLDISSVAKKTLAHDLTLGFASAYHGGRVGATGSRVKGPAPLWSFASRRCAIRSSNAATTSS